MSTVQTSNLATVGAIYAAFGSGDIPTILGHLASDVAWESWPDNSAQAAGVPWMAQGRGPDAAAAFFSIAGGATVHDLKVLSLMDGGSQIAAEVEIDITFAGAKRYADQEIHLWTFNDEGKVSRFRHYTDTAKHIAAFKG